MHVVGQVDPVEGYPALPALPLAGATWTSPALSPHRGKLPVSAPPSSLHNQLTLTPSLLRSAITTFIVVLIRCTVRTIAPQRITPNHTLTSLRGTITRLSVN